jgi:hypothetical protein
MRRTFFQFSAACILALMHPFSGNPIRKTVRNCGHSARSGLPKRATDPAVVTPNPAITAIQNKVVPMAESPMILSVCFILRLSPNKKRANDGRIGKLG